MHTPYLLHCEHYIPFPSAPPIEGRKKTPACLNLLYNSILRQNTCCHNISESLGGAKRSVFKRQDTIARQNGTVMTID